MTRAVLFDLDDTLMATIEVKWAQHKVVAAEHYGIEISDEMLRQHYGKPLTTMLDDLYQHVDAPENILKLYEETDLRFPKRPFGDAIPTVEALLDAGMAIGVVTSTKREHAVRELDREGFPVERLCHIQGEEDTTAHKPNPAVFTPALERLHALGVEPHEVAYVGDSVLDYTAATGAGISFVGVATGLLSTNQLRAAGATRCVKRLHEITPLLGIQAHPTSL